MCYNFAYGQVSDRIIDAEVERYLDVFGAVEVQGPKWCGKTMTSEQHCQSSFYVSDPAGGFQNKKLAEADPSLILDGAFPRLIDEWQEVPGIWDAVIFSVNHLPKRGNYILTGSSVPRLQSTMHSGNGRIGKINMRPMSLFESLDSSAEVYFADLFNNKPIKGTNKLNLDKIIALCVRGGWPENLKVKAADQSLIPANYIKYLASEDVSRYDGIARNMTTANKILKAVARNNQTLVKKSSLMADVGDISEPTFDDYMNVLTKLFVFENILAWSPNSRSRVSLRATAKTRFIDLSLAIAALKLDNAKLKDDLATLGFMFENLCSRDILTYAQNIGGKVFHYRERNREKSAENEIDLIVELANGAWSAFEVKLGANQIDEAEKKLLKVSKRLIKAGVEPPQCLCIISGLSKYAYSTPNGVKVVPIGCLGMSKPALDI